MRNWPIQNEEVEVLSGVLHVGHACACARLCMYSQVTTAGNMAFVVIFTGPELLCVCVRVRVRVCISWF